VNPVALDMVGVQQPDDVVEVGVDEVNPASRPAFPTAFPHQHHFFDRLRGQARPNRRPNVGIVAFLVVGELDHARQVRLALAEIVGIIHLVGVAVVQRSLRFGTPATPRLIGHRRQGILDGLVRRGILDLGRREIIQLVRERPEVVRDRQQDFPVDLDEAALLIPSGRSRKLGILGLGGHEPTETITHGSH